MRIAVTEFDEIEYQAAVCFDVSAGFLTLLDCDGRAVAVFAPGFWRYCEKMGSRDA